MTMISNRLRFHVNYRQIESLSAAKRDYFISWSTSCALNVVTMQGVDKKIGAPEKSNPIQLGSATDGVLASLEKKKRSAMRLAEYCRDVQLHHIMFHWHRWFCAYILCIFKVDLSAGQPASLLTLPPQPALTPCTNVKRWNILSHTPITKATVGFFW